MKIDVTRARQSRWRNEGKGREEKRSEAADRLSERRARYVSLFRKSPEIRRGVGNGINCIPRVQRLLSRARYIQLILRYSCVRVPPVYERGCGRARIYPTSMYVEMYITIRTYIRAIV